MTVIEMTLHCDYVPQWDCWCGIRELAQNCIDGEREHGATASIKYRKSSGTLVFKNDGIVIPREALLIGFTTKVDNPDLSGQFGEGLNLGILALVRAGMDVTIRNGQEVWKPFLERSKKFDATVLKMKISTGQKNYHGIQVEVKRLADSDWELFKKCFLFLTPPKKGEIINTSYGSILTGVDYKGMVFAKSIFVERLPNIDYGYDVDGIKVDRDRKMVDRNDLGWKTSRMWAEALKAQKIDAEAVYSMLQEGKDDTAEMGYLWDCSADELLQSFQEKHGQDAFPVQTLAQSKEIEHLGKRGVVVSEALGKVLENKLGAYEKMRQQLIEDNYHTLAWGQLSEAEQRNLELVIQLISQVVSISLESIDIVEFKDDSIQGQYKNGRIFISREILDNLPKLLCVTAHEYKHKVGEDGEAAFHHSVEELLADIAIKNYMKTQTN